MIKFKALKTYLLRLTHQKVTQRAATDLFLADNYASFQGYFLLIKLFLHGTCKPTFQGTNAGWRASFVFLNLLFFGFCLWWLSGCY